MYFRCGDCLGASWCAGERPPRAGDQLRCESCDRIHRVAPAEGLGDTTAQHYAASLRFSNERSIDIASAYAVLLGIFRETRLSALAPGGDESSDNPSAPKRDQASPTSALAEFDPSFRKAIESGHLSVQEAVRRGDRKSFAVNLAVRHELTLATAYAVADNRLSLREAVARRPPSTPQPAKRAHRVSSRHKLFAATAVVFLVPTVGWGLWSRNHVAVRSETTRSTLVKQLPVEPATAAIERAMDALAQDSSLGLVDVRRNPEGEIIEIVAPDPRAVVAAFCDSHSRSSVLEPLGITETAPRRNEARLGVFRDYDDAGSYHAIWMRKDWRTRRWVAGDGKVAIPVRDAPGPAIQDLVAKQDGR